MRDSFYRYRLPLWNATKKSLLNLSAYLTRNFNVYFSLFDARQDKRRLEVHLQPLSHDSPPVTKAETTLSCLFVQRTSLQRMKRETRSNVVVSLHVPLDRSFHQS